MFVLLTLLSVGTAARATPGYVSLVAGGGAGDGHLATAIPFGAGTLWPSRAGGLLFSGRRGVQRISADGIISTIAGSYVHAVEGEAAGISPDQIGIDGPASKSMIGGDMIEDAAGNIYVADVVLNRIFRIDAATGILRLVAGTGAIGFSGDGGPALNASFYRPYALAFDPVGNLIVADSGNYRLRRIDSAGVITTIAGNGVRDIAGDGGPATAAAIGGVGSLAFDARGNLYLNGDSGSTGKDNRVRRIDPLGRITTVAGIGSQGFSGDGGPATAARLYGVTSVWVDHAGGLLIADSGNARIRRVDLTTGIIRTVAGTGAVAFSGDGGPAIAAGLGWVTYVAEDAAGNLFISAYNGDGDHILKIDTAGIMHIFGGLVSICGDVADGDGALNAIFDRVNDQAVDRWGNLYVATICNVFRVDASTGVVTRVAGNDTYDHYSGDGGPARNAGLTWPNAIAVDAGGNVYVATNFDNRIRRVDAVTGMITTIAGTGAETLFCSSPAPVDGPATLIKLSCVIDLAVDAAGANLYFAEYGGNRVGKIDLATGLLTTVAGGKQGVVRGDGGPAVLAGFSSVEGIDVDGAGNLYIADPVDSRIRKVDAATQIITTIAGNGWWAHAGDGGPAVNASLYNTSDVEVSPDGVVYILEDGYDRIRAIDRSGIIRTVAGCDGCYKTVGIMGGDGGPATQADLDDMSRLAVDSQGNIYAGMHLDGLVRRIERPVA